MSKTVLVTGGTRGIGHAISAAMVHKGYKVAGNYAGNEEAAKATGHELGIHVYKFDVSDYDAVGEGLAQIEKDLGPIDIVVNNAGVTRDAPFHKMTKDQWQQVIDIDLTSAFNVTRQVWDGMRERNWGRIINISSINGQKGQFGQVNYSAAKAGLIGFTKSLARELGPRGVTVNAVAPGYIQTAMTDALSEDQRQALLGNLAIQRLGTPADVADAVAFLAGPGAGYITGVVLNVSGGLYI